MPMIKHFGTAVFSECPKIKLSKYCKISKEQLENAQDGEIINFNLVLKNKAYPDIKLKEHNNILFIHA